MRNGDPGYSCPDFDAAIEHIEKARTCNDELRRLLDNERDKVLTLQQEVSDKDHEIKDYEEQIRDLSAEVERMRAANLSLSFNEDMGR